MVRKYLGILSHLSVRAINLLRRIETTDDRILVYSPGGGWWAGLHRVAGRDAHELFRGAALRQPNSEPFDKNFQRYEITHRGREFLNEAAKARKEKQHD